MPRLDRRPSELQFLCPHTNRPINTGVRTDFQSLERQWDRTMHLPCPHCGIEHDFKIREAMVEQALRLGEL